jgi:hypothetical protein
MRATVEYSENKKSNEALPPIIVCFVFVENELSIFINLR